MKQVFTERAPKGISFEERAVYNWPLCKRHNSIKDISSSDPLTFELEVLRVVSEVFGNQVCGGIRVDDYEYVVTVHPKVNKAKVSKLSEEGLLDLAKNQALARSE